MQPQTTEARQFTPYDPTARPSRLIWLVLGGVAAVGAIVYFGRRTPPDPGAAEKPQVQVSGNLSNPTADGKALQNAVAKGVEEAKAAIAPLVKPAERGPNVLGGAGAPRAAVAALVPASEVERQKARARRAEKLEAKARMELAALRRQNQELGARLAQYQVAARPPPPTQTEQILQTLAPALRNAEER